MEKFCARLRGALTDPSFAFIGVNPFGAWGSRPEQSAEAG